MKFKIKSDIVSSKARFSECGTYRYTLERIWDQSKPYVNWCLMNPSIATDTHDDPTVAKCQRYARRWGWGGIVVTNAFALISTDPQRLYECEDPVGPENDNAIMDVAKAAGIVICAWGNHTSYRGRGEYVYKMLSEIPLYCLKKNNTNEVSHPLYLKESLDPIPYIR